MHDGTLICFFVYFKPKRRGVKRSALRIRQHHSRER